MSYINLLLAQLNSIEQLRRLIPNRSISGDNADAAPLHTYPSRFGLSPHVEAQTSMALGSVLLSGFLSRLIVCLPRPKSISFNNVTDES